MVRETGLKVITNVNESKLPHVVDSVVGARLVHPLHELSDAPGAAGRGRGAAVAAVARVGGGVPEAPGLHPDRIVPARPLGVARGAAAACVVRREVLLPNGSAARGGSDAGNGWRYPKRAGEGGWPPAIRRGCLAQAQKPRCGRRWQREGGRGRWQREVAPGAGHTHGRFGRGLACTHLPLYPPQSQS